MKKIMAVGLCLMLSVFSLCGCGKNSSATTETAPVENSSSTSKKIFSANRMLYEGANIVLSFNSISYDGIEFEVQNLSESDISVMLSVGLDGIGVSLWGDANDWDIAGGETKICKMEGDIVNTEHSTMSLHGTVFQDGTGIEEFDVCEAELGGEKNIEIEFPDGEELYSSDELNVQYIGADAQGLNFLVKNNRDVSISAGFETLTINDDDDDYSIGRKEIPPYTTSMLSMDVLTYNPDYFSDDVKSVSGIMDTLIDGRGTVDRFPISSGKAASSEKSNQASDAEPELAKEPSETETAYNTACSLTINDLKEKTVDLTNEDWTYHSYKGLILASEDEDWLNSSWNSDKTVNQGAIYRAIAESLNSFEIGWDSGKKYCEILCGEEFTTRADFEPYATNAAEFIRKKNSLKHVMKKLKAVSCVSGDFNFKKKKYDIVISDLSQCADEMMISEEMLGYILAMINEYTSDIIFDGNSCSINV